MVNYGNEQYKIKIYCTKITDLLLNNVPISIYIKDEINNSLQPDYNDEVDEICILYKKNKKTNYTLKCLEIFCNSEFSEHEFISYIKYMKYVGFTSKKNNIEFINVQTNEVIYNYDFVTITRCNNINFHRKVNNSTYTRKNIYINN